MRVVFPESLSHATLIRFTQTLFSASGAPKVEIDFQYSKWLPPFEALIASSEINRFKAENPYVSLRCVNYKGQSYGAHMGFFWSFGLPFGNRPGQAKGGQNYLPITLLNCDEIRGKAVEEAIAAGAIVERESERLASVLVRADSGDLFEVLAYSLREIFRNVVEHSNTDRFLRSILAN